MEKKVLKWMTNCLLVLTLIACTGMFFVPLIKNSIEAMASKNPTENVTEQTESQVVTEESEESETIKETESEVVVVTNDLDIQLPASIKAKDIKIENDYTNNIVYVYFENVDKDFSESQVTKGDCEYISKISYSVKNEKGVLKVQLSKPCEHDYKIKDGHLYIDLEDVHDVYDKIVVIDAGHGGNDPGAVRKDIYEDTINLQIVKKIKALFDKEDEKKVKVFYTRIEDKFVELEDRVKLANNLQADVFVSIHNNSQGEDEFNEYNGTMVLYSDRNTKKSKTLAQLCLDSVVSEAGSKSQGLVKGDYVYIVRASKVPVALIEVGFMTNEQELANLASSSYQKKVAQGVYDAIMEFLEGGE